MQENFYKIDSILSNIIKSYPIDAVGYVPIKSGHINSTYKLIGDDGKNFLLQKINTYVFNRPEELMDNIIRVTSHLRKKIAAEGGDPSRETLTVVKTNDNKNFVRADDDTFWRVYNFIENTESYDKSNEFLFKKTGEAFGKFQSDLSDFPIDTLFDTIPDFHNTPKRFENFKKSVENNLSGRKDRCLDEVNFVLERENICPQIASLISEGKIPLRVTHNDTKLNNVMFDKNTMEPVCIVDLDTVMPGSMLYDFGDAVRFGANTGAEDEKDLDKANFSIDLFKAFTEGYMSKAKESLTPTEIEMIPFSCILMTYECGMRFLGDYIDGDKYFATSYPDHNLVRAKVQFRLVKQMEENLLEMKRIVKGICEP